MPCLWRATVGKDHAFQLTLEAGTSDAETNSKEKIGWTNSTAAKHRNCGKMNSYEGQSIIAVSACKYMLDGKEYH